MRRDRDWGDEIFQNTTFIRSRESRNKHRPSPDRRGKKTDRISRRCKARDRKSTGREGGEKLSTRRDFYSAHAALRLHEQTRFLIQIAPIYSNKIRYILLPVLQSSSTHLSENNRSARERERVIDFDTVLFFLFPSASLQMFCGQKRSFVNGKYEFKRKIYKGYQKLIFEMSDRKRTFLACFFWTSKHTKTDLVVLSVFW